MSRRSGAVAATATACLVLVGSAVGIGAADTDTRGAATLAVACQAGAAPVNPMPAPMLIAEKVVDGFGFLEGPVWVADPGFLLMSDLGTATGEDLVQPATIRRFTPPATVMSSSRTPAATVWPSPPTAVRSSPPPRMSAASRRSG